jgi:hypothetical protein
VWITGNRNLQSLHPGQKITVIVSEARCLNAQDKIVVYGVPYAYPDKFTVFILSSNDMSSEEVDIINRKINEINETLEAFNKTDKNIRKFLIDIYYPYTSHPKNKTSGTISLMNVMSLLDKLKKDVVLYRPPRLDKSTDAALITTSDKVVEIAQHEVCDVVHETFDRVIMSLLDDYHKFLELIRESAEKFGTEKELSLQNNIWDIYRNSKRS